MSTCGPSIQVENIAQTILDQYGDKMAKEIAERIDLSRFVEKENGTANNLSLRGGLMTDSQVRSDLCDALSDCISEKIKATVANIKDTRVTNFSLDKAQDKLTLVLSDNTKFTVAKDELATWLGVTADKYLTGVTLDNTKNAEKLVSTLSNGDVIDTPLTDIYDKIRAAEKAAKDAANAANNNQPAYATTTTSGVVELATDAEAKQGTSSTLVVTPSGLKAALDAFEVEQQKCYNMADLDLQLPIGEAHVPGKQVFPVFGNFCITGEPNTTTGLPTPDTLEPNSVDSANLLPFTHTWTGNTIITNHDSFQFVYYPRGDGSTTGGWYRSRMGGGMNQLQEVDRRTWSKWTYDGNLTQAAVNAAATIITDNTLKGLGTAQSPLGVNLSNIAGTGLAVENNRLVVRKAPCRLNIATVTNSATVADTAEAVLVDADRSTRVTLTIPKVAGDVGRVLTVLNPKSSSINYSITGRTVSDSRNANNDPMQTIILTSETTAMVL